MKLDWDKNLMIKARENILKNDDITITDKTALAFYNFVIDNKVQLHKLTKEEIKNKKNNLSTIETLELARQEFIEYLNDPLIGGSQIISFIESLKYFSLDARRIKINNYNISNQDLFDTSYEVFGSINPYFERCLDYIYQNKLVKVDKKKVDYCSRCILDLSNELGYVLITNFAPSTKFGSKESIFNHELGHSIGTTTNGKFYYDDCPDLEEFHSLFMQLYTDKYLYEATKNEKYLYSINNLFSFLKEYIMKISLMYEISKIEGTLSLEKIKEETQKNNYLSYFEVEEIIDILLSGRSVYGLIIYLFSFCYVLKLFEKDEKDMKRMFSNTVFDEINTFEEFLSKIDFDFNNPYFYFESFNEADVLLKKNIRKLKR